MQKIGEIKKLEMELKEQEVMEIIDITEKELEELKRQRYDLLSS